MTTNDLLDAIGLVDDQYLNTAGQENAARFSRRLVALIAAVLIFLLSIGTAMAINEDIRDIIFSFFRIETHETPPGSVAWPQDSTEPSGSGLQQVDVVDIDGVVNAQYFSGNGWVFTHEGGFYTSSRGEPGIAPADGTFWEIRRAGIEKVKTTRIDFPVASGERTLHITFDYAVLNGKLSIQIWARDLDKDPVGNAWEVQAIGSRTDVVLLTVPVLENDHYTHDIYLLDLSTLEIRNLLDTVPRDGMVIEACWVTDDLHYALLMVANIEDWEGTWLLLDLEADTLATLKELSGGDVTNPYFLDDGTIVFERSHGDGRFDVVRHHIPTGVQNVIVEGVARSSGEYPRYRGIQQNGAGGAHGLLFREDGSIDLIDLRTMEVLTMTGMEPQSLVTSESSDGSYVLFAYRKAGGEGFSSLGLLDSETGVLEMLTREIDGGVEYLWGWLDSDTVTIIAPEADGDCDTSGNYYVYVYEFRDQTDRAESENTVEAMPPQPEPGDSDLVRVVDYIPDIAVDLRYATDGNFTGQQIYAFPDAYLRYGTVKKLLLVQEELREYGLSLKIWDAFRPAQAQFDLWSVCPDPRYVADPNVKFSSHTRGNTVDVTLVDGAGKEAEMPTGFDDFSTLADRDYSDCSQQAAKNAKLLEEVMQTHGFTGYSAEWWHFVDEVDYPAEEAFNPVTSYWCYADCDEFISLRVAPDTSAEVILQIPVGQEFQVTAFHGDFAMIRYHDLWGYVLTSYIRAV